MSPESLPSEGYFGTDVKRCRPFRILSTGGKMKFITGGTSMQQYIDRQFINIRYHINFQSGLAIKQASIAVGYGMVMSEQSCF